MNIYGADQLGGAWYYLGGMFYCYICFVANKLISVSWLIFNGTNRYPHCVGSSAAVGGHCS